MLRKLASFFFQEEEIVLEEDLKEESEENEQDIDYFHIFQFNTYKNQLYIKHKQERPEYVKIHKGNYSKAVNISKVYIIREDDVDLSYYVMLLPKEY